jgi:hypothetical protein
MPGPSKPANPLRKVADSLRALRARHEERHRSTGFGFAFADRVDYLDRATWDSVTARGSLFLRRDVLRVIEQHGPENLASRYAMIFRADKPVAVVAVQIISVTGTQLRPEKDSGSSKRPPVSFAAPSLQRRRSPAQPCASAFSSAAIFSPGVSTASPSRPRKTPPRSGPPWPRRSTASGVRSGSPARPISS